MALPLRRSGPAGKPARAPFSPAGGIVAVLCSVVRLKFLRIPGFATYPAAAGKITSAIGRPQKIRNDFQAGKAFQIPYGRV